MKNRDIRTASPSPEHVGGGTRIGYVDALKGFGTLAVVLGHVAEGYLNAGTYPEGNQFFWWAFNLIYAFHMPLFMVISGYVYGKAYFGGGGKPDRGRALVQVGNFAAVYVTFSVLFGLTKVALGRFVNRPVSVGDIFLIWGKPIPPYWYLYVLVAFYLVFLMPAFRKNNQWVIAAGLLSASFLSGFVKIGWFEIPRMMYYAFFFYLGFSNGKQGDWACGKKGIVFPAFGVSALLLAVFWDRGKFTTLGDMKAIHSIPVANALIALGISLLLWRVFERWKWLGENRALRTVGRSSLEIYVTHCFLTAGLRAVLPRIGIRNPYASLLLNLALSTLAPLGFSILCKKMKIHDLVFRPVSYAVHLRKQGSAVRIGAKF